MDILGRLQFFCLCTNVRKRYFTTVLVVGFVIGCLLVFKYDFLSASVQKKPKQCDDRILSFNPNDKEDQTKKGAKLRILCIIMTYPARHDTQARSVGETWAKRCTRYIFVTSADCRYPKIKESLTLNVTEVYTVTFEKIKTVLNHVYEHLLNQYDWIFVSDDDTFTLVDNLRDYLASEDPSVPSVHGCVINNSGTRGASIISGSAYALSPPAVRLLVEKAFKLKNDKCREKQQDYWYDVELGHCYLAVGIKMVDARFPSSRKLRIIALNPQHVLSPTSKGMSWSREALTFPLARGLSCCDERPLAFHYISSDQMYLIEYMLYKVIH